ncbi:MAG: glycosyltransferase family 4 protein [Bacteroidia bacterium]
MPKILFIAAHRPDRSPSQRFRFEQYLDFLSKHGFQNDYSYLITEKDDQYFYSPGNWFQKFRIFLKSVIRRWRDAMRAGEYDLVFVQREAFMTGSTAFERRVKRSGAKLVFDFDDAIWNLDVSDANRKLGWLKNPGKTAEIIALSDLVIAGNAYLADYAKHHNPGKVAIIPTTIDTDSYQRVAVPKQAGKIIIGWTGSITTIKHFEFALPFLRILKQKYGERLVIKVIGDPSYTNAELSIQGLRWSSQTEIQDLSDIDIGIMPLPDDEWTKGKCGLKGLQYMALAIPTIMSPVGVNTEIIQDGINGFLASETQEWVQKIELLMESVALRKQIGEAARKTVVEKYSIRAQERRYLEVLSALVASK